MFKLDFEKAITESIGVSWIVEDLGNAQREFNNNTSRKNSKESNQRSSTLNNKN